MAKVFEDAGVFGKELIDSGLKSVATLVQGLQAIAAEAADYTKTAYETGRPPSRSCSPQVARGRDRNPVRLRQEGL